MLQPPEITQFISGQPLSPLAPVSTISTERLSRREQTSEARQSRTLVASPFRLASLSPACRFLMNSLDPTLRPVSAVWSDGRNINCQDSRRAPSRIRRSPLTCREGETPARRQSAESQSDNEPDLIYTGDAFLMDWTPIALIAKSARGASVPLGRVGEQVPAQPKRCKLTRTNLQG